MKNKLFLKIGFWILVAVLFESIALGMSVLAIYNKTDGTILLGMLSFHIIASGIFLAGILIDRLFKLHDKLYKK